MRALVTGAGGWIGSKLVEEIRNNQEIDIEFFIAVDRVGVPPAFIDGPYERWIEANLDEVDWEWWTNIINDYGVDTIYYLESFENDNLCVPDEPSLLYLNRYQLSDFHFLDFLGRYMTPTEDDILNVVYLSTDKVYTSHKFPTENEDLIVKVHSLDAEVCIDTQKNFYAYSVQKILTETKLKLVNTINLRIIRPFGLIDKDRNENCPLIAMILDALDDHTLFLHNNGDQGIAFTHLHDFILFLTHKNLFDKKIQDKLSSKVINFCNVANYLTVYQLADKIINKTESLSIIKNYSGYNAFECLMATPQIRNVNMIHKPAITIEEILEEIIFKYNPLTDIEPLILNDLYIIDSTVTLSGTADPNGVVFIIYGNGDTAATEVAADGTWTMSRETWVEDEHLYPIGIFASTDTGIQYQSLTVLNDNIP